MREYEPEVDQSQCIGCGLCPDMLGEVFDIGGHRGLAHVHDPDGWKSVPDGAEQLELAALNCPTGAISVGGPGDAEE